VVWRWGWKIQPFAGLFDSCARVGDGTVRGCRMAIVSLRERGFDTNFLGEDPMTTYEIILIVMTFVIPALAILADDGQWQRKK